MSRREDVDFKTLDGLTLRGCLYPVKGNGRGPAVILTPGFACVKEMFIPEVAEAFQLAGITALTYDPRNTGTSDGLPRQEIDPLKQAEDYSDALTFLAGLTIVDPKKISFWGYSFSGQVCLTAAALDTRARKAIAVCPLTDFTFGDKKSKVLAKAMKDRESQMTGNPPFCLPVLTEKGENPAGFGGNPKAEDYGKILNGGKAAPNYRNSTTIQTYYKIAAWQPFEFVAQVSPTPLLVVTAAEDRISSLADQRKMLECVSGPKILHVEPHKGHLDILAGECFPRIMELQVDFLQRT